MSTESLQSWSCCQGSSSHFGRAFEGPKHQGAMAVQTKAQADALAMLHGATGTGRALEAFRLHTALSLN